jgi:hypothetical protein
MHPIDLEHLRSKTYFDDAISVIEKFGIDWASYSEVQL